ncbi:MAG TPA: DUF3419 family protein [Planctomycetota bacterium]|nr:DUF3419 family protein [Planctomycetota bacterium]
MSLPEATTAWGSGSFRGHGRELLFGRMYEDWRVEQAAFAPASRVFCIASAGCTAMRLAAARHRVTAVDINPLQIEYVRRRLAGGGVIAGRADRLLAGGRALLARLGWRVGDRLAFLRQHDPSVQLRWWRGRIGAGVFRAAVGLALHPIALRGAYASSFVRALPADFSARILARLERGIASHANADNALAWSLLLGRQAPWHDEPRPAPIDLRPGDAVEALTASPPGSFDGFALSNILDGANASYRARLAEAVRRAAAPGARVVLRTFAEPRERAHAVVAATDRAWLWGGIEVADAGSFH